jgi:cephalosporin-C deacetylase
MSQFPMGLPAPRPDGFGDYWRQLDNELATNDAAASLDALPTHSSRHCSVYGVSLTSLGATRVFAYFSVPAGADQSPAVMLAPPYGSVVPVPDLYMRKTYAVLALAHRGQRKADAKGAAEYPGLLTEGISDVQTFAFRGIVADCIRAAEFLAGRPEVDPRRLAVVGNDLAFLTAARRPIFKAVQINDLILYRAMECRLLTADYPLEELNDYIRAHPQQARDVGRTLSMFDPVHHADGIDAPTQLASASPSHEEFLRPLANKLARPQLFRRTFQERIDGDQRDDWLAGQLDAVPARSFQRPMW